MDGTSRRTSVALLCLPCKLPLIHFVKHQNPKKPIIMKAVIALLALVAAANAGVLAPAVVAPSVISRAPAFDSAVIRSDRLGGNFAYSVAESHAYAAHTPVVQQVVSPVAVSYSAGAPVVTGYSALAHPGYYGYGYHGLASPAVVRVA